MPYLEIGKERYDSYPPTDEKVDLRLNNYKRTRKLFKGQHGDVYERVQQWLDKEVDKGITYIVCNFPGLISKVSADMLFGEQTKYVIGGDPSSSEQEQLNNITQNNNLQSLNYEMALSGSWRGDVVYKARYGNAAGWATDKPGAIIEAVSPSCFYPILSEDNIRDVQGAVFAWIKRGHHDMPGGDERTYLRVERQLPGRIENELWQLAEDGRTLDQQVKLNIFPEYKNLEEEQETGFPGLLFKHVPNWRLEDEFWGISDYFDLESIFDELNNRLSRTSRVLDKHESPKLILPPGIMKYDEKTERWYIKKEDLDAIEVDRRDQSTGSDLPRYMTWDAQLSAGFTQIDKLLEIAFLVSETSPDAFGLGKGGAAESGRALKFRLIRLLAKINRKKLYFDEALKYIIEASLWLEKEHGDGVTDPEESDLRIEWADGIPDDPMEQAQIEAIRTGGKQTSSRRSSVRRLDDLDGEELETELQAIEEDEAGEVGSAEGGAIDRERALALFEGAAPVEGEEDLDQITEI